MLSADGTLLPLSTVVLRPCKYQLNFLEALPISRKKLAQLGES